MAAPALPRLYLRQFTNRRIQERLLERDAIPTLETVLAREQQQLERLNALRQADKLDFGQEVSDEELAILVPEIKESIDAMLGVEDIPLPRYRHRRTSILSIDNMQTLVPAGAAFINAVATGFDIDRLLTDGISIAPIFYFLLHSEAAVLCHALGMANTGYGRVSHYDPLKKTMVISRKELASETRSIAHEYTHHVQRMAGIPLRPGYRALQEGHAIGVDRRISHACAEQHGNEAFLYDTTNGGVGLLRGVYRWACKQHGKTPSASLFVIPSTSDDPDTGIKKRPNHHALGDAFFSLLEMEHGPGVYQDFIHGRLVLP